MTILLVFQIALLAYIINQLIDDVTSFVDNYKIDYGQTFNITIAINSILIVFTVGLVFNYGVLTISIGRLIVFLSNNTLLRLAGFVALAVFSILYLNLIVRMMIFYWGATAY